MADTPTPGQIAYEAYYRSHPFAECMDWTMLSHESHAAWEAAAQAVLAWKEEEAR